MEYFWVTLQIVCGILSPAFAFFTLWSLSSVLSEYAAIRREKKYQWAFVVDRHWSFISFEDCPNPAYVSLMFKNHKNGVELNIGCERTKLP